MSVREDIISDLVDFFTKHRLNQVYGCIESLSPDKKYRSVTFCRARITDGDVLVYGPKFIIVRWKTANRTLNHTGNQVCRSLEEAKELLSQFA